MGRGDGEVGSWGVGPGGGGPEGGGCAGADQGGDVTCVVERILVVSGQAICRAGLAMCVPFFRVDEFGQVDAGGLAVTQCGCPVRALVARLEMWRERKGWAKGGVSKIVK